MQHPPIEPVSGGRHSKPEPPAPPPVRPPAPPAPPPQPPPHRPPTEFDTVYRSQPQPAHQDQLPEFDTVLKSKPPEPSRRGYWRDVGERMIRAFAQGTLAALGIGNATFDKGGLPIADALYIGAGSALISVLMSLAGGQFGDKDSASFQKKNVQ